MQQGSAVVHIPATFRPDFVQYARAYYAAEALGLVEPGYRGIAGEEHGHGADAIGVCCLGLFGQCSHELRLALARRPARDKQDRERDNTEEEALHVATSLS